MAFVMLCEVLQGQPPTIGGGPVYPPPSVGGGPVQPPPSVGGGPPPNWTLPPEAGPHGATTAGATSGQWTMGWNPMYGGWMHVLVPAAPQTPPPPPADPSSTSTTGA